MANIHVDPVNRVTLWSLLFQLTAIGATGWIWAISFLSSAATLTAGPAAGEKRSKKAALRHASAVVDPRVTLVVPFALLIGYVASAVLMALPSPDVVSNSFQQYAIAAWNMFPLLVLAAQSLLTPVARCLPRSTSSHLAAIRIVNSLTLVMTCASHWVFFGLAITSKLFPHVFAPRYVDVFSPKSLFAPPLEIVQSKTFGDGVRSFMLWDQVFGYALVGLVMLLQLQKADVAVGREYKWTRALTATLTLAVVLGPGSAILVVSWIRDELLFS
jgi:hypothetical protein